MKTMFMLFGAFLFATAAGAQDWSGKAYSIGQIYTGYIITASGDTTQGYVLHGNRTSNQKECIFYTDPKNNATKKTYKPSDLKGYSVGDKVYHSINYSGGLVKSVANFVLVIKGGHLTQHRYYLENSDAESDQQLVWARAGESPLQHAELVLGFAKKLSRLLADYPELAKKVEDKEKGYGLARVFQVIDEYNQWWAAKEGK